ncbi:MAG: hypothetical protein HWN81_01125 [Candidatus Lokiarchaeota archaeon]|nr:hypothetical protein [Candidatus Lokiarchaeota archaeon]
MEKYELNKYLSLKLEDGKTNIYIGEELFLQCKSLILNIPKNKIKELSNIKSIDEATEKLLLFQCTQYNFYTLEAYIKTLF